MEAGTGWAGLSGPPRLWGLPPRTRSQTAAQTACSSSRERADTLPLPLNQLRPSGLHLDLQADLQTAGQSRGHALDIMCS